ncbi:molybdopterin cofactor-binding domain-containing protein [Neptunomonas phycophila]|uniref:molybdopterin cofactor-binding domain-containing protein n=2 Tax=Neptunomonas phycophila TaxID=1572645 RepID=UPI003736770B
MSDSSSLTSPSDVFLAKPEGLFLIRPSAPPLSPAQKPDEQANAVEMELFLVIEPNGAITALNGHVDLGTGIRTSLAQIVAEELDVDVHNVKMELGDTRKVPNQGATIASATIQITAVPLRQAAATARHHLLLAAAGHLNCPPDTLMFNNGVICLKTDMTQCVSYAELVAGKKTVIQVDEHATLKPVNDYKIVGKSAKRTDIPAKATGELTYVHDVRIPGMLHGRVIRPPYAGRDGGEFIGQSLLEVERDSISHIPGVVAIEVIGDFIGVVAEREENAIRAMKELKVHWKPNPDLPDLTDLAHAVRANPSTQRTLLDEGDVETAIENAEQRMQRTYVWPYQMHASIGPSCGVADVSTNKVTVWSGTQNPHLLRADLAFLLNIDERMIEILRYEASGCYGRNCADDVCGDAVLLSRAVGRPVRVQLTREQEHLWEPKGATQLMEVDGGINTDGSPAAYDFTTSYPSNGAPMIGLLLTGVVDPVPAALEMGDRTSIPPYHFDHIRVRVNDMAPMVRAAWLRGVSAMPNTFAHESYIDELAEAAGVDPIEYRLRYLKDPRAVELVESVVKRANWSPREGHWSPPAPVGSIVKGRGFAYARYIHSKFPGFGAAWAAWVADVEVDTQSGEVSVTRVVVGHDAGLMINPDGVRHQIQGNVLQSTSRVMKEQVTFNETAVDAKEWGAYPILTFAEMPDIEVWMADKPEEPPQGAGESASVPSAAAIANAIFDATGVRMRQPPFTADKVKAALAAHAQDSMPKASKPKKGLGKWFAGAASVVGALAVLSPWRPAIPQITAPATSLYSQATIAQGEKLFAAGDCAVCHTAQGGLRNAGGRPLDTPFGTVYSTNLTPDPETGLGRWSFTAFDRAMRQGISQDGRHLYPVFPYTAYQNISDSDMQALYAYIMSQPAVSYEPPKTSLGFPFGVRALMAGWNTLFLGRAQFQERQDQSELWNRGAYLVNGLGHCSACHSPRNFMGAEKTGAAFLSGGDVDGWEAPALTTLSKSPTPWTQEALYDYLRTGYSAEHGPAAGPMGPVVEEMGKLPDSDIQAIAHYLSNIEGAVATPRTEPAIQPKTAPQEQLAIVVSNEGLNLAGFEGERLFQGACAGCHTARSANDWFGVSPLMATNTNVFSDRPDNLIRTILNGIEQPANDNLGFMPGFSETFSDDQVVKLVQYIRLKYAENKPMWANLLDTVARIRANPGNH